jgi:anti-sigma regulatory factor (Ser/Thr protein kinase)/putative methionine-R-sulfoxide reductase with GAF domain
MSPDQARGTHADDREPNPPPHSVDRDTDLIADNLQWVTEPALAYLDLHQLLSEMLQRVTRILAVDTAAILLLEPDGETLAARAAKGLEEEVRRGFRLPVGRGFAGRIAATRQPVVIEDLDTSPIRVVNPLFREKGVRSLLGVPLVVEGRLIGVLHVGSLSGRRFDQDDIHLLQTVADRVALAVDHGRLSDQHRIAQTLQRSLLPRSLPSLPGFEFAARYMPAASESAVGGDWYDVIDLGSNTFGFAIGDVAGRGLNAATVMGEVRSAVRAYAIETSAPGEVVAKVSRFVSRHRSPMATLIYATMDLETVTIRYARAGHPYPLLVEREGSATYLTEHGGPPLSGLGPGDYAECEVTLGAGQALFLYTDGLIERRGRGLSEQEARLARAVARAPADVESACTAVIDAMTLRDGAMDDIAVLIIRNAGLGERLEFEIASRTEELVRVRGLLRRWLSESAADEDDVAAITLAASEACANAIEHAYGPRDATIAATASRGDGVVTLEVRDRGRWREPRGSSRGRGIPLMKEFMDEVELDTGREGTTVTMRRRLGDRGEG